MTYIGGLKIRREIRVDGANIEMVLALDDQSQMGSSVPGTAIPQKREDGTKSASKLPGPAPSTAGSHSHDVFNKLDPTVNTQSSGPQVKCPGVRQSTQGQPSAGKPATTSAASSAAEPPSSSQTGTDSDNNPSHSCSFCNALDPLVDTAETGGDRPRHHVAAPPGISVPSTMPPRVPDGPH
ncbi:hypothetical protein RJ55_02835 [Drechmeria coniospora]|nr:hypothetical protein RJ55_02835 [Drechmeria coniospora]